MADSEPVPVDATGFGRLFRTFSKSAFRLETLPQYTVPEEAAEFDAFVRGESPPASMLTRDWLDVVAGATAIGKTFARVHAIAGSLTAYQKYQIEWGYTQNASAGDQIGILQDRNPARFFKGVPYEDFWLFDDALVVRCLYDKDGHFLGANKIEEPAEVAPYLKARDIAVKRAVPLEVYRTRHRAELDNRTGNGGVSTPDL